MKDRGTTVDTSEGEANVKKKRKAEGDAHKRKSNIGGWILFAIVVAALVIYVRGRPRSAAEQAMNDPESALRYFAEMAYKVSHLETGAGANIDALLDLCVEEDKQWFQSNYDRIYGRSTGAAVGATNVNYMIRRNVAMKMVLEEGVNRGDFKVLDKDVKTLSARFRVEIPGPYNTSRTVNVELKKVKNRWKVVDLGGGKSRIL